MRKKQNRAIFSQPGRLLQIQSENPEIRRKGRRILFLILLLLLLGTFHFFLELPDKLAGGITAGEIASISFQIISGLIIALTYIYLIWTANRFARESEEKAAEAQARVAQLSSLHRFTLFLSEAPGLTAIFEGARREIFSFVEATGMSISLLTPDGRHLDWIYGYEFGQEVDLSAIPPLPISEGFAGYVARNREMLYVNRAVDDVEKYRSIVVGASVKIWLGLPMIVTNKLVGVLAIENETDFSEREISLLKTIVGPLAIAIQNARLLAQAEARAQRQLQLNRISAQLHQTADVENIINLGLRALSDATASQTVSLRLGRSYSAPAGERAEPGQK